MLGFSASCEQMLLDTDMVRRLNDQRKMPHTHFLRLRLFCCPFPYASRTYWTRAGLVLAFDRIVTDDVEKP